MTYSLGEIEALARKAARGAGLDWATATEAGASVRWLCRHDVDGVAILASLLTECEGISWRSLTPEMSGTTWRGASGLCPLAAGLCLADFAEDIGDGGLTLKAVHAPGLLLSFAAGAATSLGEGLALHMGGALFRIDGTGSEWSAVPEALRTTGDVTVSRCGTPVSERSLKSRSSPDPDSLAILTAFAHRTYAPASEASRLKGAGAGTSDND